MFSKEEIIVMKFDAYVTKSLKNLLRNIKKQQSNIREVKVNFSDLTLPEKNQLLYEDKYEFEDFNETIVTRLFEATIHSELLHKALLSLKKEKREIILLKYWGDMTDKEIGQAFSMSQQTVNYNRNKALKLLKDIIKELEENGK